VLQLTSESLTPWDTRSYFLQMRQTGHSESFSVGCDLPLALVDVMDWLVGSASSITCVALAFVSLGTVVFAVAVLFCWAVNAAPMVSTALVCLPLRVAGIIVIASDH
jgi:hypothetical protein